MNKYFLGIDTSAYTTSLALIDNKENLLYDLRLPLTVKRGARGLRQQEAVFQHLNNFPRLISKLSKSFPIKHIHTVAVSSKPRNLEESYMPVFIYGRNQGYILAQVLGCEFKEFSHQEGHIGAALINNKKVSEQEFFSFHISGGTTEFLQVKDGEDNLNIKRIGGTLDISFGQLIDRLGVYLGLDFPCGKKLDELSRRGRLINLRVPISIKDKFWLNLSGLENYFVGLVESGQYSNEDISLTLFHSICLILSQVINSLHQELSLNTIILTGGVMANTYIRRNLGIYIGNASIKLIFPSVDKCTDNGVGIAYLAKRKIGHKWGWTSETFKGKPGK
ncbi:MAG TPA: hypothetical protein VK031_01215 [Tissierellaceae bacterium]|nr:hypothetical protein [Tissierellaceae bacterium]